MPVTNKLIVPPDYISGLELEWVSATSIKVKTGEAYVPDFQGLLAVTSDITVSGISLGASTLGYVYLYETPTNTGNASVEVVTTAPATPYRGTARAKTADTSRRYLGAVKTDASSNIYRFKMCSDNWVQLNEDPLAASGPYTLMSDGRATTPTAVSASGKIPAHIRRVLLHLEHYSTLYAGVGTSEMGFTLTNTVRWTGVLGQTSSMGDLQVVPLTLNASQEFQYDYSSDPGAGAGLRAGLLGYLEER